MKKNKIIGIKIELEYDLSEDLHSPTIKKEAIKYLIDRLGDDYLLLNVTTTRKLWNTIRENFEEIKGNGNEDVTIMDKIDDQMRKLDNVFKENK